MQTVGLNWQHSFEVAAVLALTGTALAVPKHSRMRATGAFLREASVIGALYGLWRVAGEFSVTGVSHAMARARWIQHFEHDIGLPSEHFMQHLVLGHPLLVQFANLYYDTMHFTMMLVFLIWLFVWHRERYRPIRQVMAWATLGCLAVQLIPVAPPRMLPGIVDTAAQYGQSVYVNGLAVDQMGAMPSVHVAWAMIVGYYTFRVSTKWWRWLGPVHTTLTVFFVVVTGNHWWLDGIVATLIVVVAAWSVFGVRLAWHRITARPAPPASSGPLPELEPIG